MSFFRNLDRIGFVTGLCLALAFVAVQSVLRIERIRFVSGLTGMPADVAATPGVRAREVVLPSASIDSAWWVMHTEAMLESEDWRVRETSRDNAPKGREVHWSSALMWTLALLAWLIHLASGFETAACVQHAAVIAGPLMFAVFIVGFACVAARKWAGAAGGLLALGLASLAPLDEFFRAGEADHHGIGACFSFGMVLCALAAGAGRVARAGGEAGPAPPGRAGSSARCWMIASGLFGAAALWVSAATVVPVLVGVGAGALAAAWAGRRAGTGACTEAAPALWRTWGLAGAAGSVAFYLLEYAPGHFGWRLEVNHPLFALAWLGGAEVLAALCAWIGGGRLAPGPRARLRLVLGLLAALVLPSVVLLKGAEVFVLRNSFLWRLHEDYIHEFRPLSVMVRGSSWRQILATLQPWCLIAIPAAWALWRRPGSRASAPLAVAVGAALPMSLLALDQIRWLGVAQSLWLVLLVIGVVELRAARPGRLVWTGAILFGLLGLASFPSWAMRGWWLSEEERRILKPQDSTLLVMRDVAWKIRRATGSAPVNILSGPTTTTNLAFFGDSQGVGTLYWENLAGLKTAAAIYGAQDAAGALRLCLEHKVTHVVIFSWDVFAQPYARLHHGRAKDAGTEDCFVSGLLTTKNLPVWLRPVPYALNPKFGLAGQWLHIFEVRPEQKPSEAFYHLGVYLNGVKRPKEGLDALIRAWNLDPGQAATGRALGLALIKAGRVAEARTLAEALPDADRLALEFSAGRRLAEIGAHAAAVSALHAALALAPTEREIITDLAWLLAVSADPAVRDGKEALRLASALGAAGQAMDLRAVDALAAAYAETGDFQEARAIIAKALDIARREGDAAAIADFEERSECYAAGRPFRLGIASSDDAAGPAPEQDGNSPAGP